MSYHSHGGKKSSWEQNWWLGKVHGNTFMTCIIGLIVIAIYDIK